MNWVGWRRICFILVAAIFAATGVFVLLSGVSQASTNACEVCIIEVQTTGLNSASEDYVVLGNNTASSVNLSGVSIKYITAGGTANSKTIALSGNLIPHASIGFVASNLQTANPSMQAFPSGLAFADDGGTLQLTKAGSVIDEINWGNITKTGFSGTVAPKHTSGYSLVRKQLADGSFQDTNDNRLDFIVSAHACTGLSFNEIQPFSIDSEGKDLIPALEILKASDATVNQDCPLQLNNQLYDMTAGDLSANGGLIAIEQVIDSQSQILQLPLNQDTNNDLQMVPSSLYGAIQLPLTGGATKLTQPTLLAGQSYAKFSSGWKPTYSPTIGSANKFTSTPLTAQQPVSPASTDVCEQVVVNELLPNPLGDDASSEWVELRNLSSQSVSLANCVLSVNGTLYQFGPDVFVNPGGFPVYQSFSDGETNRALSLKNSDTNTVSFGRLNITGSFEAIQTFQYKDAPEGQSWARFDDGWRWLAIPTPGLDNATVMNFSSALQPTEFAASSQALGDQTEPTASASANSPVLQITELLPNPAAPGTDEENEYVELYNPTDQIVDLTGYKIETGSTYAYSYTIPSGSIGPGEYKTYTSGSTSLTLANSTGQAHLVDPDGQVVSTTDPYQDAPEGEAWALIDGLWVWTAHPTPAIANIYVAPPAAAIAVKAAKKASPKTTKAVKAAATKKAATKSSKSGAGNSDDASDQADSPMHTPILVGIGASALLYAAYEYRTDAANLIHKLRRNRGLGRHARQSA